MNDAMGKQNGSSQCRYRVKRSKFGHITLKLLRLQRDKVDFISIKDEKFQNPKECGPCGYDPSP